MQKKTTAFFTGIFFIITLFAAPTALFAEIPPLRTEILTNVRDNTLKITEKTIQNFPFQSMFLIQKKWKGQGIGAVHKITAKATAFGYLQNANTQKKIRNILENLKNDPLTWETARDNAIETNKISLRYLLFLKKRLISEMETKHTITEINNITFLENEIATVEAFNRAYSTITPDWIQKIETKTGESIDDVSFATQIFTTLGTLQLLYHGYVSPFTTVGASGLLLMKTNEPILEKQYTNALITLPTQIEIYAENTLGLTGEDFETFTFYYKGRIETDILPYLDFIANEFENAESVFANDTYLSESIGGKGKKMIEELDGFLARPEEFTPSKISNFLSHLIDLGIDIKKTTETEISGTKYRATEKIRAIVEAYGKLSENTEKLYGDLMGE
ncbi:hypothetical protein HZA41_02350 [Candidatus Peregrinibacteria bacterium]|nr:hypothetical protein [Candidatus Peregrinibacteria bacterium]